MALVEAGRPQRMGTVVVRSLTYLEVLPSQGVPKVEGLEETYTAPHTMAADILERPTTIGARQACHSHSTTGLWVSVSQLEEATSTTASTVTPTMTPGLEDLR